MLGDENKNMGGQGYDAYTQPADAKKRKDAPPPYSFTYESTPPLPPNRENGDGEREGRRAVRTVVMVLLILLLIVLVAAVTVFFIRFEVQFSGEDGVFSIQIVPRGEELPSEDTPTDTPPLLPPEDSAAPSSTPGSFEGGVDWDGTTMVITSPPPAGETGAEESPYLTYPQIYAKCAPSVVVITAVDNGEVFTGTGIIMAEDGYIVTCSHLVSSSAEISVALESGDEYAAVLIGQDNQTDLAVLKIEAQGLTPAEFGDSNNLQVGETVVAIGNPLGQYLTMTDGIVSAIDRNVEHNGYTMTLVQTNAAINEGNSGGPLINLYGQVVGITNMKMMSYYSTVEGIGFAIPISSAKAIVDELLQHGYIAGRPAIGIQTSDIPAAAAAYYNLPAGALVEYVYPNTDAYAQGLLRGDIITEVDGIEVSSTETLDLIGFGYQAGDQVTLTLYRNGSYLEISLTLCDLALLGS